MTPPRLPIPSHWVGLWKGYGHLCTSISEALASRRFRPLATRILGIGSGRYLLCSRCSSSMIIAAIENDYGEPAYAD